MLPPLVPVSFRQSRKISFCPVVFHSGDLLGGFKTSNFFFDLVSEKSRKLLEFKNLRESEGKFEIIFPHILQILRWKNFVTLSVRIFVIRTS